MAGGIIGGPGSDARATSLWLTDLTPLARQLKSPTVHATGISHFFIKMYQFIARYFSWMHGWFCFITARKSLHRSSCKRYTWTSRTSCWKDGNVLDLKITHHDSFSILPTAIMALNVGNINFTEHEMHYFPNFQQEIKSRNSFQSDVSCWPMPFSLLLHLKVVSIHPFKEVKLFISKGLSYKGCWISLLVFVAHN